MKTVAEVEARLAAHSPWIDPQPARVEAGVAAVVREAGDGLELLFIRRAEHDDDPWSGDLAFPGGRVDPEDADPRAAASREVPTPPPVPASTPRLLWPLPPLRPPRTTASSSSSSPGFSIEKMASSLRAACPRSLDASLTGAATDGDGRGASADDAPGPTPPAAADVSESFGWIPRASARSAELVHSGCM